MSTRATLPIAGLAAALLAVLVAAGVATSPAAAHPPDPVPPTDGALSWGDNNAGQLGDGSTAERHVPGPVSLPDNAALTQLDAGVSHTLALTLEGRVLAWGDNGAGQLGDGSTDPSTAPVEVALPEGVTVTQVAAGSDHGLALTSDGRVLAWGSNAVGQLGDGTTTDRTTPVEVQLPEDVTVTRLSAGEGHSLALTDDGRVLAWGGNVDGQLGDGTTTNSNVPVEVDTDLPAGQRVVRLAAGWWYSLALTTGRVATDTSLTADPTEAAPGDDVALTATVTCTGATSTGTVTFLDGRTELGTAPLDGSGAASLTTNRLGIGEHRIRARYDGDDTCGPSISDPVTVTVAEAPPTTTEPPTTTQPTPPAPSPTDRPQPTTSDVAPVAPTPPSGASPSTPDATPHDPLAATGVPAGALTAGALALIAAGLGLTLWARRRRDH